jgi:toxin FitB
MYLLDTNVISELRKSSSGKANLGVTEWAKEQSTSILFISAITVMELETGVLLKKRKDKAQGEMLDAWLHGNVLKAFKDRIIPFDEAVALQCAKIHVPDRRSDRDALIAATALVHSMTVVTRNVDDFVETGCKILNPWTA